MAELGRSLILGAGGFLGTNLFLRLLEMGVPVRGFGRRPRLWRPPDSVEWIEADLADLESVNKGLAGVDTVYHLVSTTVPSASPKISLEDLIGNVIPTIKLLDLCVTSKIRKIVFASSGGTVYGRVLETPILETSRTEPISSYGVGKLTIEKYLNLYKYSGLIDPIVLRISNPFGPFQLATHNQGAIAVFAGRALDDKPIEIWGDGSVVRDYLFVGDVVDALVLAARYEGSASVFNVGSSVGRSVLDIVRSIEIELGKPVQMVHKPGRIVDVPANVLDITKARDVLGWQPKTTFENGLRRTIDWIKATRYRDIE